MPDLPKQVVVRLTLDQATYRALHWLAVDAMATYPEGSAERRAARHLRETLDAQTDSGGAFTRV